MKNKTNLIYHLLIVILIFSGCTVKKYVLSPEFYSSGSNVGLIVITNDISTLRSGQGALDKALTRMDKYAMQLQTVKPKLNPESQFKDLHLSLLKSKGKNITLVDEEFDEGQFEKFEKPDNNKKYFNKDIRSLRDKYQVDELMIASISYGLNINYYGVIEMGKGGYSHIISQIINLNDNSIIYRSESWGGGALKSKWDTPPDYEYLRIAIATAIYKSIELEKTKY